MKTVGMIVMSIFLISCTATSPTPSQHNKKNGSIVMNTEEKAYISYIEKVGYVMYLKDIRAARATDLFLTKVNPSDYPNFVGWVTYFNDEDFTVTFYEESGNAFNVIADVIFGRDKKPVLVVQPKREPSPIETSMIRARISALNAGLNACSENFNTIVLNSKNEAAWDVYVIAANTDTDMVQLGGHIRVTVSKTTGKVIKREPLSKSCLTMDKTGKSDPHVPEDSSVSGLYVTHIISPMPVAIHPYLNLLHRVDLAVMSPSGFWMIKGGKIRLVSREKKSGA